MRKVTAFVPLSMLLCARIAAAQAPPPTTIAFPGSIWMTVGNIGPSEPDNTAGQTSVEQGLTVWHRGPWFLVPYVGVSLMTDTQGYDWNNRHPTTLGLKLQHRIGNGVISAGGGVMFESNPASGRTRHASAFVNYWAGWQGDLAAQDGGWPLGYPGAVNASSGLLTGRDPHNWMSQVTVQQGLVAHRWHGLATVPFGSVGVSFDTKDRPWQNRATTDAGVKVMRAVTGGVIEAGIAQRHQRELISGHSSSGPVAFVNLWIGWNPGITSIR